MYTRRRHLRLEKRQQGSEMVYNKGLRHTKDHKDFFDGYGDGKHMKKHG